VRLVLELQLLAAGEVQRQRRRRQQDVQLAHDAAEVLMMCNQLLLAQVRCAVTARSSWLLPEVLQQAGLQLLQALAAPMQLSTSEASPELQQVFQAGRLQYQLYVLLAAASGVPQCIGELNAGKQLSK
jgi:hypothetical protein